MMDEAEAADIANMLTEKQLYEFRDFLRSLLNDPSPAGPCQEAGSSGD